MPHSELNIGRLETFEEIIADFQSRAKTRTVFFKDMGYYVLPEIYRYPELSNQFAHLILIRNPKRSILSYYQLDANVTLEEIGIEAQWKLYEWLCRYSNRPPFIVEAESVQNDPMMSLGNAWDYLDLPFLSQAFEWQSGEVPDDWQSVSGWHQSVIASSGIRKTKGDDLINMRFAKAAEQSPRLLPLLDHHQPFYEKLKVALANQ